MKMMAEQYFHVLPFSLTLGPGQRKFCAYFMDHPPNAPSGKLSAKGHWSTWAALAT
jgi:hypothetical protein